MKQRLGNFTSVRSSTALQASVVGLEKGQALNRSLPVEMFTKACRDYRFTTLVPPEHTVLTKLVQAVACS